MGSVVLATNATSFLHHRVQLISSSSKSADVLACYRNTLDVQENVEQSLEE